MAPHNYAQDAKSKHYSTILSILADACTNKAPQSVPHSVPAAIPDSGLNSADDVTVTNTTAVSKLDDVTVTKSVCDQKADDVSASPKQSIGISKSLPDAVMTNPKAVTKLDDVIGKSPSDTDFVLLQQAPPTPPLVRE